MATQHMTEAQAVNLVRNALLVAGHEMGETGDHWPVVKATVFSIMKDYEDYKIEQNVFAELKIHYGNIVKKMEKDLALCPAQHRAEADKIVAEIRDSYEACFSDTNQTMFVICDADEPIHVKRAREIIKALEEDNG